MSDFEQVRQAKTIHRDALLQRANVVGVGVGYKTSRRSANDELSVVVLVRQKLPLSALSAEALVPQELGGIRTDVIEVGELRALASDSLESGAGSGGAPTGGARISAPPPQVQDYKSRQRPALAGVSIGHYQITAGTLGCVVRDRASGRRLILSNNHVLANCNQGRPGDPILQPAPADGGEVGPDTIAVLERFIPLKFNAQPASCGLAEAYARLGNLVARWAGSGHQIQALKLLPSAVNHLDAALARPLDEDDLQEPLLNIGPLYGTRPPSLGLAVCKAGRTTAFTQGVVQVQEASVVVNYGPGRAAAFEDQVIATPMSQGGDSGSLIASVQDHRAVGLLFAGSPQATIFTPIQTVLDALLVDLPGTALIDQQRLGAEQSTRPLPAAHGLPGAAHPAERVQAVRQAHQARLLAKANVVGVGIGLRHRGGQRTNQLGLVVLVERKLPLERLAPEDRLPSEIDGVPVDVKEVGKPAI